MNVHGISTNEKEPEPPDVAGAGEVVCPCGHFKMAARSLSPGMGLQMTCPHCGTKLESWVA